MWRILRREALLQFLGHTGPDFVEMPWVKVMGVHTDIRGK
jgi:hypothetical protein